MGGKLARSSSGLVINLVLRNLMQYQQSLLSGWPRVGQQLQHLNLPCESSLDLPPLSANSLLSLSLVSLRRKSTHRSAKDWQRNICLKVKYRPKKIFFFKKNHTLFARVNWVTLG
jgi:hypothetical protein